MAGMFVFFVLIAFAILSFGLFAMAEGWKPSGGRRESAYRRSLRRRANARTEHVPPTARARRISRVSPSAEAAMQRAGYDAGPEYAHVVDIGLLAYRTTSDPRLIRSGSVMTDTDYLRPYAELWVPYRSRGPVRFELIDGTGRLRYADEGRYDLEAGRNPLLPGTWLPLTGKWVETDRTWQLRVSAGKTVLAVHEFSWQAVGESDLRSYIESDGEISPELQAALRENDLQAISLDELLSDQAKQ